MGCGRHHHPKGGMGAYFPWKLWKNLNLLWHTLVLKRAIKAVHRVPHHKLLYKLSHYGIQGSLLSWIQVFLTKRTQRVALEGVLSNQCFATSGVSQGTVLGPLLFLIYINDLPLCISPTMRLFADDCFLYCRINSPVDCQNIQKDLDALTKWEKDWQMSFSVDKCHIICFSTEKSSLGTTYVLNNHVLTQVHHHSYLGVILSKDLKWSEHIVQNYNIKCQTNSWYH